MAAFDLTLKLQTGTAQSDEQRAKLKDLCAQLQERADQLRAETLKVAAVATVNAR